MHFYSLWTSGELSIPVTVSFRPPSCTATPAVVAVRFKICDIHAQVVGSCRVFANINQSEEGVVEAEFYFSSQFVGHDCECIPTENL